jgi:DNA sulfur modification protein DndE
MIEHIRLSQKAKEQLMRLKAKTGITQWNILCRWAFCISLAEPSIPPPTKLPADSNVEMTWRVFGGADHEIYEAILKERCRADGLGTHPEVLNEQFRQHLHRGIGYLFADKSVKDIASLLIKVTLRNQERSY